MCENSMIISASGKKFVLTNLNEKVIKELTNDSARLSQYVQHCFKNQANIYVVEDSELLSPANVTLPRATHVATNVASTKYSHVPANVTSICSSRVPAYVTSTKTSLAPAKVISIQTGRMPSNVTLNKTSNVPAKLTSIHTSRVPVIVTSTQTSCSPSNCTSIQTIKTSCEPTTVNSIPTTSTSYDKRIICAEEHDSIHTAKKTKTTEKLSEEEQNLCDEILASQVMAQPMLYNHRLKSHKFSSNVAEKWRIIGDRISEDCPNVDTSITKLKERWTKIRDDYLKRVRLTKPKTGSGRTEIDEEPLDELLSGLKDVYCYNETASNIVNPEKGSEDCRGLTSKERKNQNKKFEEGALEIIESNSEKFLSAIENMKDSLLKNKENQENVNQDKAAIFCDLLKLELRELDDKSFFEAQIQILQVISKLRH